VNFKTRDEEGLAVHRYFWNEEQLGSRGGETGPRPWLEWALCFVAFVCIVSGLAGVSHLMALGGVDFAPAEDSGMPFNAGYREASDSEPRFDAAWDEAHREQREKARDAIWQLLLAPDFRTRQPFVLHPEDEAALREYDTLHSPIEPDSVDRRGHGHSCRARRQGTPRAGRAGRGFAPCRILVGR